MPTDERPTLPSPQATSTERRPGIVRGFEPEWWVAREYFKDNPTYDKLSRNASSWRPYLIKYYRHIGHSESESKERAAAYLSGPSRRRKLQSLFSMAHGHGLSFDYVLSRFVAFTRSVSKTPPLDGLSYWRHSDQLVHSFECLRFPSENKIRLFMCLAHAPLTQGGQSQIKLCFDSHGKPWIRKVESKTVLGEEKSYFRTAAFEAAACSDIPYALRTIRRLLRYSPSTGEPLYHCKKIAIMPYFDSGTLWNWLERLRAGVTILEKNFATAATIAYLKSSLIQAQRLHQSGVLHLDIKLENIFLHGLGQSIESVPLDKHKRATVYLGDFGLAKFIQGTGGVKTLPVGTRDYKAPEMDGDRDTFTLATPATDAYSFGVMCHEFANALELGELQQLSHALMQRSPDKRMSIGEAILRLEAMTLKLKAGEFLLPAYNRDVTRPTHEPLTDKEQPKELLQETSKDNRYCVQSSFCILGITSKLKSIKKAPR